MSTEVSPVSSISTKDKAAAVAGWLTEKKAEDLLVINHSDQNSPMDTSIIVTANSLRHGQGLADYILERCREEKYEFLQMEGYAVGLWILLDLNDVVVHIFQEETRELYNLDDLWTNASVILDSRKD